MLHAPPIMALGPLGTWEMIVIVAIALLLFGTRIPSIMRSLGRGVVEFKKGLNDPTDSGQGGSPA